MIGSASIMRQALVQAMHHARHRRAFGKPLVEQPLMRNVLADLALESEAATALAMRVARAVDASPRDATRGGARAHRHGDREVLGVQALPAVRRTRRRSASAANGYVEESTLPRLYRQAPLNSIWEGSGNIQCLDVLRALGKEPASARRLLRRAGVRCAAATRCSTRRSRALRKMIAGTASDLETRARQAGRADGAGAAGASCLVRGGQRRDRGCVLREPARRRARRRRSGRCRAMHRSMR